VIGEIIMAKITAPNAKYNDVSAGVRFSDGVGYTDKPHLIEWFKNHGYAVDENATPDFGSMTVKELLAYAADRDIALGTATKKDEILAILKGGQ
jgi:hypothetical protein